MENHCSFKMDKTIIQLKTHLRVLILRITGQIKNIETFTNIREIKVCCFSLLN